MSVIKERMCLTCLSRQMVCQACNAARAGDAVGLLRLYVGAPRMAPYLMVRPQSRWLSCAVYSAKGRAALASSFGGSAITCTKAKRVIGLHALLHSAQ